MIKSLSGVNNTVRIALYVIHNPRINRISIIVILSSAQKPIFMYFKI